MFYTKYSGWLVVIVLLTKYFLAMKEKKTKETVGARDTYGVGGRI